jgi:hypothetical protein
MRHLLILACLLFVTGVVADEADFDFKSLGAKKALRDYKATLAKEDKAKQKAIEEMEAEAKKARKKYRVELIMNLEQALKKALQDADLEEANKISDAIKALKKGASPAGASVAGSKGKKSKARIPRDSDSPLLYRFFEYDQKNNGFAVRTNAGGFSELVQLESYRGKEHVLRTHPDSESNPAIFSKVLRMPRSGRYALRMGVSHHIHNGINRD